MRRLVLILAALALFALPNLPGSAAAPQKPPSAKRAAFASNALGIALERRAGRGNVTVSPWSAWTALSMVYTGAAGETRAEMARVLHVRTFGARTPEASHALTRALRKAAKKSHARLDVANRLWGDNEMDFVPDFLATLRTQYGAPLRRVDFAHDPEGARALINRWVTDHTNQRIKDLFAQGDIDDTTLLAIVNALYFKARWDMPFDPGLTRKEKFHAPAGDVRARTMHLDRAWLAYARLKGLRAVELPYRGRRLSMLVVLPDRGHMKAVQRKLSARGVQRIAAALHKRLVDLSLPRFKVTTRLKLADMLSALGMPRAFSDSAEFPGIAPEIKLGAAVQKAWIRVGEKGTEAAAATGLTGEPLSMEWPPPTQVKINRPFLFFVRDNRTGAILFLGRITDPTK